MGSDPAAAGGSPAPRAEARADASPPDASGASAESGTGSGGPSAADLEELLATLEDEEAREELASRLRALLEAKRASEVRSEAEAGEAERSFLAALSRTLAAAGDHAREIVGRIARPAALWSWLRAQAREPELRLFWLRTLAALAAVFTVGAAAWLALRLALRGARRRLERREPPGLLLRVPLLAARALLELLPVAAFGLAAHAVLAFAAPPERVRLLALTVVQAVVVARAILVVARLVMTPLAPALRLVRLADDDAAYTYVWTARLVNVGVYGVFAAEAAPLLGAAPAGRAAILHATGLVLALLLFVLILQSRERVAAAIRGPDTPAASGAQRVLPLARRRLAEVWHVLASLYVLGAYAVWALDVEGGFVFLLRGTLGTLAAAAAGALLARLGGHGVDRLFRVSPELRARFPGLEARAGRYVPAARAVVTGVVALAAGIAALETWGVDAVGGLASEVGLATVGTLVRIGLVLLLALLAWELSRLALARFLISEGEGASQRSRTLLPLAQTVLLVVITTITAMTLLAELGVDIGPLLAGAGILGLAVGFGAQTLVKDVITGAFILFEDAISVGDIVEVGGYTGLVEAINVRSIRHRDLSGALHTIPFSSVDVVRNLSKVYSYYLTDVGVAYREDTDEVVAILRRVLDEMRAEPAFAAHILEPLDVMGVQSFDDSAVAVRVRIKTRPGEQFGVGREFNRRLKKAFDAADIEIPFPHRTLYFGTDKDGTAPPARVRLGGTEEAEASGDGAARPPQATSRSRPDSTS